MYRLVVLYPPPKDPAAFRSYYEGTHLPLAAKLPGMVSSHHGFDVQALGAPPPYFCIWEGTFDSRAAMTEAMQSPAGQAVAADVQNYATGGSVVLHYEILGGGDAA